jgi:hypothetical protein
MILRRTARRILVAAAISMIAHAALLAGSWLTPPESPPELPPLTARLEPLPPEPKAAAAPARQTPRRIGTTAPSASATPAVTDVPGPAAAEPASPSTAEAPVVIASAEPTTFRMPETPPLPSFPRKGQITYQLTMGPDKTPVGRTVQTWEFEDTRYRLGSQSEST